MGTMIELLLVVSVLGNAWQYVVNDDLKEVNVSNVAAVKDFSVSLGECSDRLVKWKRREQEWQQQEIKTEVQLNELESSVSDGDWGDCRVPVDLEL
tara:strand:+ start:34798 stop:35085 length:288 start_codon:yes stop_codon:yes gene_type:complete